MRLLAAILSLYFLGLSIMPCMDAERTTAEVVVSQSQWEQAPHQDDCSPFCICNCCGVAVSKLNAAPITLSFPIASGEKIAFSPTFYTDDRYSDIWQPPKIG